MLPKPDVTALTGGYRRTPFLQRGADIWCDTALMARVIDRAQPTPPLYPPGVAGAAQTLAQWADFTLFWAVIPYTLQPQGIAHVMAGVPPEGLKAFAADRAPFTAGLTRQTPTWRGWRNNSPTAGPSCSAARRASPTSRWRTACGSSTWRRRCSASSIRSRGCEPGMHASAPSSTARPRS
jgi:hypothetical protein